MSRMTSEEIRELLQMELPVPFAVYQFVHKRVVTCYLSPGFCEMFGYEPEEAYDLMNNNMYRDAHPDDVARIAEAAYRFASEDAPYDVFYRSRRDPSEESYMIVHALGKHIHTEKGRLAVVWYVDEGVYTETSGDLAGATPADPTSANWMYSVRIEEENRRQNHRYDFLTGLPTFEYFMELAEEFREDMVRKQVAPAMLFFDLSGMKGYNEKYGFEQGDELLRSVAGILKNHFSTENCGRIGTDHFAAFYEQDYELETALKAIFREIAEINGGRSLPIRVGIYDTDAVTVDSKTACDRAKLACDQYREGYGSYFTYFDTSMLDSMTDAAYVLDNLKQALREGWVRPYYQPIVRSVTGLVCNEEALARWIDPDRGMLPPDKFIPVLEDAQMLYQLDLYMVGQVAKELNARKEAGMLQVPISVNLSWSDFQKKDMVNELCRIMDHQEAPHELLCIELTESIIGKNPEFMRQQIDRFHEKGFQVWMDDFGSGYSSLDILHSFEFDLLKFNMQFMQNFNASEKSRVIMGELVHMAARIGIDTLAEGVELPEQVQFLREIGCDKIQGYYFSRPNPSEEVIDRYQTGRGIGMEDTRESAYYDTISKTSLKDPAISNYMERSVNGYFSGVPMGILETYMGMYRIVRHNKLFSELLKGEFQVNRNSEVSKSSIHPIYPGPRFRKAIQECIQTREWVYIDNVNLENKTLNAFVKKLADDPVTGASAVVTIFLSMMEDQK